MAWQAPVAMSNGGGGGGGGGGGPVGGAGDGAQGTEYTLQGVMRFLQLEWHRYERERNGWDIERAEMKAKIAKMEGEARSAKKLNDSLNKQIRMLEKALKNERSKSLGDAEKAQDGVTEVKKEERPPPRMGFTLELSKDSKSMKASNKPHNSFLDVEPESSAASEAHREEERDKSRDWLRKCVQEISYLLTPPSHPPPNNVHNLGDSYQSEGEVPMSLDQAYMQQKLKNMHHQGQSMPSAVPNHHPPPVPDLPNSHMIQQQQQSQQQQQQHPQHPPPQAPYMTRELGQQSYQQNHLGDQEGLQQPVQTLPQAQFDSVPDDQVEQVTHSYDAYGRHVSDRDPDAPLPGHSRDPEADGWNFEEASAAANAHSNEQLAPPRRPDTDLFPSATNVPAKSPPRAGPGSHRRKSSQGSAAMARRRSQEQDSLSANSAASQAARQEFKVRFALRGHLDVVRSVIFTGGGSPSEPEICTTGDDGLIKRWIIPATYNNYPHGHGSAGADLDVQSYFTHRGHEGIVTSLAACPPSSFSTGGRALGDGWIFSAGQDATIRVWERGRVDPKATLDGHTDAVWTVCVLPANVASVFGPQESSAFGGGDRILIASGSADGTIKIWAVSAPPQVGSPATGSRRGVGGSRRHSVTSGSNFPSSPQPSVATATPFHHTLIHSIQRPDRPSPTCISPLSMTGETFVVAFSDANVVVYDTRTGEEHICMASTETYDGTPATGVNTVVATTTGFEGSSLSIDSAGRSVNEPDDMMHGPTGSSRSGDIEGMVISGHEDRYIRFFDANSGQCTYSMLAHPAAISALSLSKDGREAVSAGHDASIRFWSLEKRICTQELTSHRIMRGEGVCSVVWSQDGRFVVSAGGDGVVKVFARG